MLPEVEVVLLDSWPGTVRIFDLIVVPVRAANESPARYRSEDVSLAVEIVSPGAVGTDRVTKSAEYAKAGIPGYWIVDLDKPATLAYTLKNEHYVLVAESATTLTLDSPAPLTLDPAALTPPWR